MAQIPLLASVALLDELPDRGLTRGQMGTVVEYLSSGDSRALLVEFADDHGETYSMAELNPEQLVVLHRGSRAA